MKITSRFLAVFMCLIILGSGMVLPTFAAESEHEGGEILKSLYIEQQEAMAIDEREVALQGQLNDLYQIVEDAMKQSNDNASSVYMHNRSESELRTYSDTYAGSYIDDNVLVVCVTNEDAMNQIDSELIRYRLVENSYNELDECKAGLTVKYRELYQKYKSSTDKEIELLKSISGFGVDEELNSVIVDIANLTAEKETLFVSLFGVGENLIFQEVDDIGQDATGYKPGQHISVITGREGTTVYYASLSIGYRAYRTTDSGTEYGFATCGHGIMNSIDGNVYAGISSTVVGTISDWMYEDSVDAAFVKLSSGNSITMTTMYSDDEGTTTGGDTIASHVYMTSVAKGSTVYKVGATTYKTSAEVTNTNYDFVLDNGTTFSNMTKTESFCDHGDSGGLVYMYYNEGYKPAGLVKGMGGWWLSAYSVYTKASEVVNGMSIIPY